MTAAEIKYHVDDLSIQDKTTIHVYATTAEEKDDACKALKALESLESEYEAYHTDSDYWRGVRYALDMMGGKI